MTEDGSITIEELACRYEMTAVLARAMLFNLDLLEKEPEDLGDYGRLSEVGVLAGAWPTWHATSNDYLRMAKGGLVITVRGARHIADAASRAMRGDQEHPEAAQEAFLAVEAEHVEAFGTLYLSFPVKGFKKKVAKRTTLQEIADHYRVPFGVASFFFWSDFPTLIDPRKAAAALRAYPPAVNFRTKMRGGIEE